MKSCIAAAAALLLSAPAAEHGPVYAGLPPERFLGDHAGIVIFTDRVEEFCGPAPSGMVKYGCAWTTPAGVKVMAVLHPRNWGHSEFYARLMAHEVGHWNGWGVNHEL